MLPDISQQRLEDAVRRWQAAEQRLYPAVMAAPEAYERYIQLVRAIADELGFARTPEALLNAYADAPNIAGTAALREMIPTVRLDVELAAAAAFWIRYREVVGEMRQQELARRLEEAKDGGWVLIYEAGQWVYGPYPPWRKMEMHLPEGTGLHVWVEESLDDAGLEYGVEVVMLDPKTGRWLEERAPLDRRTFRQMDAWKEAVEGIRSELEQSVASEL